MKSSRSTVKILLMPSRSATLTSAASEIHRAVGILEHELSYAGYVYQVEGEESHRSSRQHLPESFLGFWKIPQPIDGFDEGSATR